MLDASDRAGVIDRARPVRGDADAARWTAIGIAALAALTLSRLWLAAHAPLSPDEAYYWVWSRALAAGYPDHPPMVALWIRAGTWIAGQTPLGVRLLGPLSGLLGTFLLADAAQRLFPAARNAGLFAAAALNATLMLGAGTVIMTPDTPLMFFWIATMWALARFHASARPGWLLAAGAASGCALASKYTAAFLGFGAGLWFVVVPGLRPWLRRPWPWLAAALGLAIFAPVVAWNAAHHWASFLRQGGRLEAWRPALALRYLPELIGGQIALATPLLLVLFTAGVAVATLRAVRTREAAATLLALLSVPPLALFAEHALGDRVQANWPAVVYPAAAIAAAAWPVLRAWRRPAIALGAMITAVAYVQVAFAPLPLPPSIDQSMRTLAGWQGVAGEVEAARVAAGASFVVSDEYGLASELAFYLPASVPVVAVDPRWALFDLRQPELAGQTGLFLKDARRHDLHFLPPLGGAALTPVGEATRGRDGIVAERFLLYRVAWTAANDQGSALLPHPGE